MSRTLLAGTTNHSTVVRIIDSTDGTPETGVTSATGGLAFNYRRTASVAVAITALNDLALLTTAHTDGGILHIGDGYYRLDFQDAAFAAGAVDVLLTGTATGMVVIGQLYDLVLYDAQDAMRLGLTALPNANADAAFGLPISDAGGLAMDDILADTADMQPKLGTITDLGAGATVGDNLADMAGGTFAAGTDSLEDIRDAITALNDIGTGDLATALTDIGLDHLLAASVTGTDVTDDSIIAKLVSKEITADWDDFVNTTDSLQAIRDYLTASFAALNDISTGDVDTALTNIGLDHLLAAAVVGADVTDDSIIAQLAGKSATADWDTFDNETDSLEALRDRGDAEWITGTGTGLTAVASGTAQGVTASTIQLAASETFASDEMNGNIVHITGGTLGVGQSRMITDYDGATDTATVTPDWTTTPTGTITYEITAGPGVLTDVTPFQGADVAEILADTVEIGTPSDLGGGTTLADNLADMAGGTFSAATDSLEDIRDAITALQDIGTGDLASALTDIGLDHLVAVAVTDPDVVDNSIVASLVSKEVVAGWDDYENTTDSLQAMRDIFDTRVPDVISLANIETQVDEALDTTTYSEPGIGIPGATISLAQKIGYLYKAFRNKTTATATAYTLFSDGDVAHHTAVLSDDGTTAQRTELVSA